MKKYTGFAVLLLCLIFIVGCTSKHFFPYDQEKNISKTSIILNTAVTITLYGTDDTSIIDECFTLCENYEKRLSRTIETSEIYRLNHRLSNTVSDETILLLENSLNYFRLSNGAFDITIAPLTSLWNFSGEHPGVPSPDEIDEAKSHVGSQNISVSGNEVTFSDSQAMIDLGAIAKGYIADQLKEFLLSKEVDSAIINLGGNVLCVGSKPDGSDFQIGIQYPFDEQNKPYFFIPVSDWSVVTSGIYERYFIENDTLYHHILNPATGYPCENDLLSVTILSRKSIDGDALSTTCFLLGREKGLQLIDSLEDTYAIFITRDYNLYYSDGLEKKFPVTLCR